MRPGGQTPARPLIEDGWPTATRGVLAHLLPPADVDRAGRVLLGGIPPEPDELGRLSHTKAPGPAVNQAKIFHLLSDPYGYPLTPLVLRLGAGRRAAEVTVRAT